MDTVNTIIALAIIIGLMIICYQLGLKKGRRIADQILGENHRTALRRIKRQAERSE